MAVLVCRSNLPIFDSMFRFKSQLILRGASENKSYMFLRGGGESNQTRWNDFQIKFTPNDSKNKYITWPATNGKY